MPYHRCSHTGPSPSETHSRRPRQIPHTAQGAPMKPTTPDRIRNVALISHGGAGKTSLAEAMLFDAGAISRLGTVEAGTDDPRLGSRRAQAQPEHQPVDRLARARRRPHHPRRHARLRRLPGRCGRGPCRGRRGDRGHRRSAGVEVGTEEVWRLADARGLPRLVFINKMDRENANYDAALDQLKARFGPKIAPVYLPIGSAETFRGYVDVIEEHATSTRAARRRRCRSPTRSRASSTRGATRWSRPPPRRVTS